LGLAQYADEDLHNGQDQIRNGAHQRCAGDSTAPLAQALGISAARGDGCSHKALPLRLWQRRPRLAAIADAPARL
jgi:hypothetical protein